MFIVKRKKRRHGFVVLNSQSPSLDNYRLSLDRVGVLGNETDIYANKTIIPQKFVLLIQ